MTTVLDTLTSEERWTWLKVDPLAYIRELALAHHEALRDGADVAVVECPVLVLDDYRRSS